MKPKDFPLGLLPVDSCQLVILGPAVVKWPSLSGIQNVSWASEEFLRISAFTVIFKTILFAFTISQNVLFTNEETLFF
jgi:hypothetical protein